MTTLRRHKKAATVVTELGSVCAALTRRGKPPSLSGAQHRGLVPSWCRHDAADRVEKAASDGFSLVETGETEIRCGNCRMPGAIISVSCDKFPKLLETSPSAFPLPSGMLRSLRRPSTPSVGWFEKLCTTSDAATSVALRSSRNPCLLPCAPVGHHSVDLWMASSAKWHVSAVLHSCPSFTHCRIFGLLPWNVKSSSNWFQALCCSSAPSSLSSQGGGASGMLVFVAQMLWTGMVVWTSCTHVLAVQVRETTIRVSCDTSHT